MTVHGAKRSTSGTFVKWTNRRAIQSLGTNSRNTELPIQDWYKVKEAFTPELIQHAHRAASIPVTRCIDPFGGSGTTGLACQFLGVHPVLSEVNPFLADLIEAKLSAYPDLELLTEDLELVTASSRSLDAVDIDQAFRNVPPTLIEPGINGRWVFDRDIAKQILSIRHSVEELETESHQRLFKIMLANTLIPYSNTYISGKGRRYRSNWKERKKSAPEVLESFISNAGQALGHIREFGTRERSTYELYRGDSRSNLKGIRPCQMAVCSPPYPNSSDYTDIYNLELWMLGYLTKRHENTALRKSTISSHVQISRDYWPPPVGSATLDHVIETLNEQRDQLWNSYIPEMIGSYFAELMQVIASLHNILDAGAAAWIVLGDSQYRDVRIPVAEVLKELAQPDQWTTLRLQQLRTMNVSAQQGGQRTLPEHLLVLQRA